MAVAPWKNNKQVTLETQKWKPLNIEGRSFLIKGIFCDNCYEILVSDYCTVWEESLSESDIMRRSKVSNFKCVCVCVCHKLFYLNSLVSVN